MIYAIVQHLALFGTAAAGAVRGRLRRAGDGEAGMSTLETVILILGGITLAALLVAALTQAVQSRIAQIR